MNTFAKKTQRHRQAGTNRPGRASTNRAMYSTGKKTKPKKQGFSERMSKMYMKNKKKFAEKQKTVDNEDKKPAATSHGAQENADALKPYDTRSRNQARRKVDFNPKGRGRESGDSRKRYGSTRRRQERVRSMQTVKQQSKGYLDMKMKKETGKAPESKRARASRSSRSSSRRRRGQGRGGLVTMGLQFEIDEEEEPSVENHLSIDGDDAKVSSKPQSTSKPRVENLVSVDKIVDSLEVRRFEAPKPLVNLRQNRRGKQTLQKTLSSSKVGLAKKKKKSFAKELASLAPKDNQRIDDIILLMKSKAGKAESFKDSVESLLNESIERKQVTASNYMSNTRVALKGGRPEQKRRSDAAGSQRSGSTRRKSGYYDRLHKKKQIKQSNKGKIGISYLTPEMQKKKMQTSRKTVNALSQRSHQSNKSQKSQRSQWSQQSQLRKTGTILFNSKIRRELSKKSIFSRKVSAKKVEIHLEAEKTKEDTEAIEAVKRAQSRARARARAKPRVQVKTSARRPHAKTREKVKTGKVSPKIRIMNTKRQRHAGNFKRGKVHKTFKSTTSLSQKQSQAKRVYRPKPQRKQTMQNSRPLPSSRKKENAQKQTPKEFQDLNDSDHKKLDEIKREFQRKFAVETKELNRKNQRGARTAAGGKKQNSPLPIMAKKISYSKSTTQRQKKLRSKMATASGKQTSRRRSSKHTRRKSDAQKQSQVLRNLLLEDSDTLFGYQEMVDEKRLSVVTSRSRRGNVYRKERVPGKRRSKREPREGAEGIQNIKDKIIRRRKVDESGRTLQESQSIAESSGNKVFADKKGGIAAEKREREKNAFKSQKEGKAALDRNAQKNQKLKRSTLESKSMKSTANAGSRRKALKEPQTKSVVKSMVLRKKEAFRGRAWEKEKGSVKLKPKAEESQLVESVLESNFDKTSLNFSLMQSERNMLVSEQSIQKVGPDPGLKQSQAKSVRKEPAKQRPQKRKPELKSKFIKSKAKNNRKEKGANARMAKSKPVKPSGRKGRAKKLPKTPKNNIKKSKGKLGTPKTIKSKKSGHSGSSPRTGRSGASGKRSKMQRVVKKQRETSIEQQILEQIFSPIGAKQKEIFLKESIKSLKKVPSKEDDSEVKQLKLSRAKPKQAGEVAYMSLTGTQEFAFDLKDVSRLSRQPTPKNSRLNASRKYVACAQKQAFASTDKTRRSSPGFLEFWTQVLQKPPQERFIVGLGTRAQAKAHFKATEGFSS